MQGRRSTARDWQVQTEWRPPNINEKKKADLDFLWRGDLTPRAEGGGGGGVLAYLHSYFSRAGGGGGGVLTPNPTPHPLNLPLLWHALHTG